MFIAEKRANTQLDSCLYIYDDDMMMIWVQCVCYAAIVVLEFGYPNTQNGRSFGNFSLRQIWHNRSDDLWWKIHFVFSLSLVSILQSEPPILIFANQPNILVNSVRFFFFFCFVVCSASELQTFLEDLLLDFFSIALIRNPAIDHQSSVHDNDEYLRAHLLWRVSHYRNWLQMLHKINFLSFTRFCLCI